MTKKLSTTGKEEVLRALGERYTEAKRAERQIIRVFPVSVRDLGGWFLLP
jgi:hypothetical protein